MSEESTNAADVRVGEPVVRIEGLRKSFGDNVVLRGIDLEVQRGEVVVILGPSGSGKMCIRDSSWTGWWKRATKWT